jgi:predicted exporter
MIVLVRGDDYESVLEANDGWADALADVAERGVIRTFESFAVLQPSRVVAARRRAEVRGRVDLAETADRLGEALAAQGFRPEPFADALDRLRAFAADAVPGGVAPAAPWLAWFAEKHVAKVGDEWRVTTQVLRLPEPSPEVVYDTLLASAPPPVDGVAVHVTGLSVVEDQAERMLEWGTWRMVLAAMLALWVVLALHYRRLRVVLIAWVPLAGGLLVFVGFYAVLGIPLTFFAMAGIPLLVGVGIDDHLFMLDRYLEHGGRPGRLDDTLAGSGRAIVVTTLTTLAAFGVLSLSRFEALASMGAAVSLALGIAFVSSVILLPALLARFLPGPDAPRSSP